MFPILFKLGPFSVFSYGVMAALGFLAGILVSLHFAKKEGFSAETILDLAVYVIIGSIIGARLLYVLGQWHLYKDNLLEIFMLQHGGLVVLGGVIAAILVVFWFAKKKKISFLKLFDICTPATLLGLTIGRIGCFLNGCCFGVPTDCACGVNFPPRSLAHSYFPHEHLWPTQLFSSAGLLIAFLIIFVFYQRKKFDGQVFFIGLIFYSIYRFTVEFYRFSPMHWLGLTPSQWVVILLSIIGVWGLIRKSSSQITR